MSEVDYKQKYINLKAQYKDSVDVAYRLGIEQGAQMAQMQQMQQQADQQAMEAAQQNGMGGDPSQPGQPGQEAAPGQDGQPPEDGAPAQSANPQGSELDQHIEKLESMLGKSELTGDDLKKAIEGLKDFQKNVRFQAEMKKSHAAIPAIAKALHKPAFKIGTTASHNMSESAKRAVSMQEQIVKNVMDEWTKQEQSATKDIAGVLNLEGILKQE